MFHVRRETVRSGSLTFSACSPLLPQLPAPGPVLTTLRPEGGRSRRTWPASSSEPLGLGGWAACHETADAALLWTQTPRKPNAEANGISGQQENSVIRSQSYCSLFLRFPELKV